MKPHTLLTTVLLATTMTITPAAEPPSHTVRQPTSLTTLGMHAIQRAVALARERDLQVSVACVDASGQLLAFARTDDVTPISVDTAIGKAYTSAVFRADTSALYGLTRNGQPLSGLEQVSRHPRDLVMFPGGVLIRQGGRVVGALGVSGAANSADDEALARDALL